MESQPAEMGISAFYQDDRFEYSGTNFILYSPTGAPYIFRQPLAHARRYRGFQFVRRAARIYTLCRNGFLNGSECREEESASDPPGLATISVGAKSRFCGEREKSVGSWWEVVDE